MSAENWMRFHNRAEEINKWLSEQTVNVKKEQAHVRDGTRERLYWHYGYMVALRDVLKKLSS